MLTTEVLTTKTATITAAKQNPNAVLDQANGEAVAVLANNVPRYYMVPPDMFKNMVDSLLEYERQNGVLGHVEGAFKPDPRQLASVAAESAKAMQSAAKGGDLESFEECR